MNSTNDITTAQTEATTTPVVANEPTSTKPTEKAKGKPGRAPKVEKAAKPAKPAKAAKADADGEATDRLPTTVKELKETKGGFVASLFLAGKDKDGIAKELKVAFKLSETQAVKITRRITGRVRLYQRIFELVAVKK